MLLIFFSKCNPEMVELLPLNAKKDIDYVQQLLEEFEAKTGSLIARELLDIWPEPTSRIFKVFPYEYQRALQQLAEEKEMLEKGSTLTETAVAITNGNAKNESVMDIEDVVADAELAQKKLDKIKGFMKYKRQGGHYRPVEKRMEDWGEIYNFQGVRKGLKVQAARCMECGVPFCQSSHGCPLGNIIPKWNDLVFQDNWKEALNQLLQTNNFPG